MVLLAGGYLCRVMPKRTVAIILVSFFILLATAFFLLNYKYIKPGPKALSVLGSPGQKVRSFTFINQEGNTVTNADVKGKVYVAAYFFATCKGICPKMNENLNKVYEAYKGRKDFMILSHTVDPEKDTPAALKAYSDRFEADPSQWMFLTGDKGELYKMARYSYLINAQDTINNNLPIAEDFIHDEHFVLVDREGYLRGKFYDGLDSVEVRQLITDIATLLKEKK